MRAPQVWKGIFILCLNPLILSACGGGGSGSPTKNTPTPAVSANSAEQIQGTAVKGLMSSAIVIVHRADTGAELARTRTEKDGAYQVKVKYKGAVTIEVTTDDKTLVTCDSVAASGCGTYASASPLDLNKNGQIDFGEQYSPAAGSIDLMAYLPQVGSSGKITASITPVTDIAWKMLQQSGDLSAKHYKSVTSQLNNLLGIAGDDLSNAVDITRPGSQTPSAGAFSQSVLASAIATWAYQQSGGFQQALDRLAAAIADNALVGTATSASTPDLDSLMTYAVTALRLAAANNPKWPSADLASRFQIRQYIAKKAGANTIDLPKPGVDYTKPYQDRINKGKALIADLRGWGHSLVQKASLMKADYSDHLVDLKNWSAVVNREQPLLESTYRFFDNPSDPLLKGVWIKLYPCLVGGVNALKQGAVASQPTECPAISLSGKRVSMNGDFKDSSGQVIGQLQDLSLTESADGTGYSLSGTIKSTGVNGDEVDLSISDATWSYQLYSGVTQLANNWAEAQKQLQSSQFSADLSIADTKPAAQRTAWSGTWTADLNQQQTNSSWTIAPALDSTLKGTFTCPQGTISGTLSASEKKKPRSSVSSGALNADDTVAFTGTVDDLKGDVLKGTLTLGANPVSYYIYSWNGWWDSHFERSAGFDYLNVAFSGSATDPAANELDGTLKIQLLSPTFSESQYTSNGGSYWWYDEYYHYSYKYFRAKLSALDIEGKSTKPNGASYQFRASLNVHNPEQWVVWGDQNNQQFGSQLYSSSWFLNYPSLAAETKDHFLDFSGTLMFKDSLPGQDSTWVALAVDRTVYKGGIATLQLTSTKGNDWRSLEARYDNQRLDTTGMNYVDFTDQSGATLRVSFQCDQPSQNPFQTCSSALSNLSGTLTVDDHQIGTMKFLDNNLIKVTYNDGEFETLQ